MTAAALEDPDLGPMEQHVLISLFEVPKGEDASFLTWWEQGARHTSGCPGFVATKLHRAVEPDAPYRFVSVTSWRSIEDYQRAFAAPSFSRFVDRPRFRTTRSIYEVVVEKTAGGGDRHG